MQKKWPLALGFLLIVALSVWFLKSPPTNSPNESDAQNQDVGPALSYETHVAVKQRVEGQSEATVLDIRGLLDQTYDLGTNYLSRWARVDTFTLMNSAQDAAVAESLVGKSVHSHFALADNAFAHDFQGDFPKEFVPFHASLFHRTLLPIALDDLRKVGKLTTKERDEVGDYEATYTIAGDRVTKQWVRYLQDSIRVDRNQNTFVYTFHTDGRLLSVDGDLILHYRQSTPTRFQITIAMKRTGPASSAVAPVDNKTAMRYSEADIAKGVSSSGQSVISYEQAMSMVDSINEQTDTSEIFRIFTSLKYSVDLDPARARDVIAKIDSIKERDASSKRRISVLFGALAQTRDSSVSTLLADMAETCPDSFCKIQAIAGVNSHPNPTPESLDKMLAMAEKGTDVEITSNALLAAGAAGSRLENPSPELTSTLIDAVTDPAKTAIKPAAIAAMGNHGSAEYLPHLQKNISDPSGSVRSAALYGMRHIADPAVDKVLLGALNTEKDPTVLRDALKVLDYRSLTTEDYEAIAKKTATITDVETQRIGARVLVQVYREDPTLVESSLNTLASTVKDADVKEYIETEMEKIKADQAAATSEPAP